MSRSRRVEDHPFFDHETGCRKTAWGTPRHLSDDDWLIAKHLAESAKSATAFYSYIEGLGMEAKEALFYRIIGYPEGRAYVKDMGWVLETFYPGFIRHQLPLLLEILSIYREEWPVINSAHFT